MGTTQIAIYGAGGFAREVAWLAQSCDVGREPYEVVCFVDDDESTHGSLVNGIPVMGLRSAWSKFRLADVVGGVESPHVRQRLMEKAAQAGFGFATIIHPRAERSRWIEVGQGTVICAGTVLTTNVKLGRHVQVNPGCTIGHDVVVGDYSTLAPGVHVSGWVHLGERVYVGTGAVIVGGARDNPLTVGNDAVIGAGACVAGPVASGLTVAGAATETPRSAPR